MFFFLHVFLGAGVVGVLGKHTFFFSSWGGGSGFLLLGGDCNAFCAVFV